MPNKILKYNYREKSKKVYFTVYAALGSLFEGIDTCHNNPEKSTTIVNKCTPSEYSLFTQCSFDAKNKLDCYRGKDEKVWKGFVRI